MEKKFIRADEVAKELEISESHAYKIIFSCRFEQTINGDIIEIRQTLTFFNIGHSRTRFPYLKILVMYECLHLLA